MIASEGASTSPSEIGEPLVPGFETCGVRIDALGRSEAAETVVGLAKAERKASVHLCNAYTLSLSLRDQSMQALLEQGDLNLMDGMPLVWMARRLGHEQCTSRVYGPDLMLDVMDLGREAGLRHYLYGSTPEVVTQLTERLQAKLPGLDIAASESPPFRPLTGSEEDELEQRFRDSGANVVWVGLGTPKQDVFVHRFRDRAPGPVVAIGAAFDFHAGLKRQAPAWLQERGLEWAFRLATEPQRLWRRYLIGNSIFLLGAAKGIKALPERRLTTPVTSSPRTVA